MLMLMVVILFVLDLAICSGGARARSR